MTVKLNRTISGDKEMILSKGDIRSEFSGGCRLFMLFYFISAFMHLKEMFADNGIQVLPLQVLQCDNGKLIL